MGVGRGSKPAVPRTRRSARLWTPSWSGSGDVVAGRLPLITRWGDPGVGHAAGDQLQHLVLARVVAPSCGRPPVAPPSSRSRAAAASIAASHPAARKRGQRGPDLFRRQLGESVRSAGPARPARRVQAAWPAHEVGQRPAGGLGGCTGSAPARTTGVPARPGADQPDDVVGRDLVELPAAVPQARSARRQTCVTGRRAAPWPASRRPRSPATRAPAAPPPRARVPRRSAQGERAE